MAYSDELWRILRALYESGHFSSIPELRENCKKIYPDRLPSQSAIEKRASMDGWNKHQLAPVIEQEIESAAVKMFADLGMPREEAARRIIAGITLPDTGAQTIVDRIKAAVDAGGGPVDERVFGAIKDLLSDYSVAHRYVDSYIDITGWQPAKAVKVDYTSKGKRLAAIDPTTVEDIETRVLSRIKKLQKAGVLKIGK